MPPQLRLEGLVRETDVPVLGHFRIVPDVAIGKRIHAITPSTRDTTRRMYHWEINYY